jgi:hypothetical protein
VVGGEYWGWRLNSCKNEEE